MREAVMQAVGEASGCWGNLEGRRVFDSTKAQEVGERLLAKIDRRKGLVEALRSGKQADRDGTFVTVSRQACEEAASLIEIMSPHPHRDRGVSDDMEL